MPLSKIRLLVFTSHPIQYQAPLFRALAARPEIDLEVCFYSRWGVEKYIDPQFGVPIAWDIPLLDGYHYRFLRNAGSGPGPSGFWSLLNPEVLPLSMSKQFDAIWMQGWATASNWLAWLGTKLVSKPLLLRGESNGLDEPTGWKGVVKRAVLGTFLSGISGVFTIGRLNQDFYKSYGLPQKKLFPTPYAVDNSFFFAQADRLCSQREALRRQYQLQPDLPVVLYTGKLIAKKRPFDLIKAFQRLRRRLLCTLALVGDGALRPELERFVAEQRISDVHFLGFRNQSEIGQLYALSDVFVLPSSSEPWGLSLNEALCFGLPAVVSDQVGSGMDLIEPGVNGYRFACGDIESLAKCLESILTCEERRVKMGAESRRKIGCWGIEQSVTGIVEALHTTVL